MQIIPRLKVPEIKEKDWKQNVFQSFSFLVEVRRVELLSENTSRGTSPCADDYLHSLIHT